MSLYTNRSKVDGRCISNSGKGTKHEFLLENTNLIGN